MRHIRRVGSSVRRVTRRGTSGVMWIRVGSTGGRPSPTLCARRRNEAGHEVLVHRGAEVSKALKRAVLVSKGAC